MLTLSGQFITGGGASDGGCAGSMQTVTQGTFGGNVSDTAKASGTLSVNSPASFYALPGISPTGSVQSATFLFLRLANRVVVKITQYGTVSGDPDIVSSMPLAAGATILNFPAENALKSVEIQGATTVEYLAAGSK